MKSTLESTSASVKAKPLRKMVAGPRNRPRTQIIQEPQRVRRSAYRLLSYSETRERI